MRTTAQGGGGRAAHRCTARDFKRPLRRPRSPARHAASPHRLQLERCGCGGLEPAGTQAAPAEGLRVEDPRQLRRRMESELASHAAQDAFMAGLAEVVADEGMLRQALLPMVVTSQVC